MIQTNQVWSEILALLAMGVSRNASVFNKHLSRESTQGFRKDKIGNGKPFFLCRAVECGQRKQHKREFFTRNRSIYCGKQNEAL